MASIVARTVSRLSDIPLLVTALPRFSWTTRSRQDETCEQLPWAQIDCKEDSDLRSFVAQRKEGHRCLVFGEQHHQPRGLAAMLMVLDELTKSRSKLHALVLEAFNVLQQPMLDAFNASWTENESPDAAKNAATRLMEAYEQDAGETFDLSHYMPAFLLARERRVKLIGGFPPRTWARKLAKEGLTPDLRQSLGEIGFDRWESLHTTSEHRAYIRSLISGEPPFVFKDEEMPTKGVVAAQALKDAVFAFRIEQALQDGAVLAICGSGHCEYGFGVPERIQSCKPLLIVTKAVDEPIWQGSHWGEEMGAEVADAVVRYEAVDEE